MSKILKVIGLMSGTSLDGIDVALIETDGEGYVKRGPSMTYAYDDAQQTLLRRALADAPAVMGQEHRPGVLGEAEVALTQWHITAVQDFLRKNGLAKADVDLIGFHGQTVYHRPDAGLTVQLGLGQTMANALAVLVAYDLRAADVAAGGQGAPLVPVYHQALAPVRPCVFVNIGGVANVTYVGSSGELLAFDTGPGNALINDWMKQCRGLDFDEGGKVSATGRISQSHLFAAIAHPYFAQKPPKSLDRNTFAGLDLSGLEFEDGAATLAAFTAYAVANAAQWFPETPKLWIICGGGRHNAALMNHMKALLGNVVPAEAIGLNGDSMEAEAWAYLAARSYKSLPLTFPGTTGVTKPTSGGVIVKPA